MHPFTILRITFALMSGNGGLKTQDLWKHYFRNTQGVIFVIDSNDRDRVVDARDDLHRILNEVPKR